MGNTYTIKQETLQNIANSIRNKTGKTDSISVQNYASEVDEIPSSTMTAGMEYIVNEAKLPVKATVYGNLYQRTLKDMTTLEEVEFKNYYTVPSYAQYKYIPAECFYNCTSLKSVNFPDNITSISRSAFYKCSSIEEIHMPKNLSSIGGDSGGNNYTFAYCTNLKRLYFYSTIGTSTLGSNNFYMTKNIEDVYVPWSEGEVEALITQIHSSNASPNATIHYNWTPTND